MDLAEIRELDEKVGDAEKPDHLLPSQDVLNRLYGLLSIGTPIKSSCRAAGMNERLYWQIRNYAREGDTACQEVVDEMDRAMAMCEVRDVQTIDKAVRRGDVKSAMWRLERRNPEEWGRKEERLGGGDQSSAPIVLVFPGGASPLPEKQPELPEAPVLELEGEDITEADVADGDVAEAELVE